MQIVTYQKLLAFSKIICWLIFTAVPHITPVSAVTKLSDITQKCFMVNLYIDLSAYKIKFGFKTPLNIELLKKNAQDITKLNLKCLNTVDHGTETVNFMYIETIGLIQVLDTGVSFLLYLEKDQHKTVRTTIF